MNDENEELDQDQEPDQEQEQPEEEDRYSPKNRSNNNKGKKKGRLGEATKDKAKQELEKQVAKQVAKQAAKRGAEAALVAGAAPSGGTTLAVAAAIEAADAAQRFLRNPDEESKRWLKKLLWILLLIFIGIVIIATIIAAILGLIRKNDPQGISITKTCTPAVPNPGTGASASADIKCTISLTKGGGEGGGESTGGEAAACGSQKSPLPPARDPQFSCSGGPANTSAKPSSDGYYKSTNFGCNIGEPKDPGDNCIPGCLDKIPECKGIGGRACEEKLIWYAANAGIYGCNTRLKVTNPTTGKAVIVTAIDYGPGCQVQSGRQKFDVSQKTIKELGGDGITKVEKVPANSPLGPVKACPAGGGGAGGGTPSPTGGTTLLNKNSSIAQNIGGNNNMTRAVLALTAGQTFTSQATGYTKQNNAMEGGPKDMQGKELNTIQDFLAGKAPYAAVAMDKGIAPYGTELSIKEMDEMYGKHIVFKLVDTGGAFMGKGTAKIDICVADQAEATKVTKQVTVTVGNKPSAASSSASQGGGGASSFQLVLRPLLPDSYVINKATVSVQGDKAIVTDYIPENASFVSASGSYTTTPPGGGPDAKTVSWVTDVASIPGGGGGGGGVTIGNLTYPPNMKEHPQHKGYFLMPNPTDGSYKFEDPGCTGNHWGSKTLVGMLYTVAQEWKKKHPKGRLNIGDLTAGAGHASHKNGVDVDLDATTNGTDWVADMTAGNYNRQGTIEVAKLLMATGTIKLIFYNDAAVRSAAGQGKMQQWPNHENHFHIRTNDTPLARWAPGC